LKFLDYKCRDCGNITEVVVKSDNGTKVKCSKCGSTKMVRIFAPVGFKNSSGSNDFSSDYSSGGSCSSGSCTTCSGCK